jgi:hypothetical protein
MGFYLRLSAVTHWFLRLKRTILSKNAGLLLEFLSLLCKNKKSLVVDL